MGLSLLDKMKATAVAPAPRSLEEIEAEIHAMRSAQNSLFGIEKLSAQRLEEAAFRLGRDKKFLGLGYKRLSLEPLSWTKGLRQPLPVFALYGIDDPIMTLSNSRLNVVERPLNFPPKLAGIYAPIIRGLDRRGNLVEATSTFQGTIPMEVRPKIKEAIDLFEVRTNTSEVFNRVFLMAEVENWDVNIKRAPRPPRNWDPLVVGWDGLDLWLITSFDLTELERYVINEFPAIETPRYLALPEHK